MTPRPTDSFKNYCIANWKMHGDEEKVSAWTQDIATYRSKNDPFDSCAVILCPPMPLIPAARDACHKASLLYGAQDCHTCDEGPYTGFSSPKLLASMGATYCIIGHSERRFFETDDMIHHKIKAALQQRMTPILCVGESWDHRQSGHHFQHVQHQVESALHTIDAPCIIAYEPIWAIGTGKTPTLNDIQDMHTHIHQCVRDLNPSHPTPILYGGSVSGDNVQDIVALTCVQGVLVGGASLTSTSFMRILAHMMKT